MVENIVEKMTSLVNELKESINQDIIDIKAAKHEELLKRNDSKSLLTFLNVSSSLISSDLMLSNFFVCKTSLLIRLLLFISIIPTYQRNFLHLIYLVDYLEKRIAFQLFYYQLQHHFLDDTNHRPKLLELLDQFYF